MKWCPRNPKWAASLLETIGPRGALKELLQCETVQEELKRRGHNLEEFGIKETPKEVKEEIKEEIREE